MENKNKIQKPTTENNFENDLYSSLKHFGYLIPTTDDEVKHFEETCGTTDIEMPEELISPDFIHKKGVVGICKEPSIAETKSKSPNDYFKKLVLAAEIASQLHSEPTFGHVKFVKIYCLCQQIGDIKLSTKYEKFAAGPLDPKLMYSIDAEFKKRKWFNVVKKGQGYKYIPSENAIEYKKYYLKYFALDAECIERVINLFRKENSSFCEKVATLFFVWKEAKESKSIISDELLFKGFYAWDESKLKYTKEELSVALNWMNQNEIVPA